MRLLFRNPGCGLTTSALILRHGWRAMFVVGSVLPVILLPFAAIYLVESPAYLIANGRLDQLRRTVERLGGMFDEAAAQPRPRASPLRLLFDDSFAAITPLIWMAYFCTGATIYFFLNWLPILLTTLGLDARQAALTASVYQVGGLAGGALIGWIVDRLGGLAMAAALLMAALMVTFVGWTSAAVVEVTAAAFGAGFLVVGSQNTLHAYVGGGFIRAELARRGLAGRSARSGRAGWSPVRWAPDCCSE